MYTLKKDNGWLYFEMGGIVSWPQPNANSGQCTFDTLEEAKEIIEVFNLTDVTILKEP